MNPPPKQSKATSKPVRARKLFAWPNHLDEGTCFAFRQRKGDSRMVPVALIEQVARIIFKDLHGEFEPNLRSDNLLMNECRFTARAVLESLAILPKQRRARK